MPKRRPNKKEVCVKVLLKIVGGVALPILALCFCLEKAAAQTPDVVPTKPVTVVLPVGPGGSLDTLMRSLSVPFAAAFGQQMIIEYKPGGGGVISTQWLRTVPPDGYSLVLTYPSLVINPMVMKQLPYDTSKDILPVALIAKLPGVLAVNANLPIRNMGDLVAYSKANPGKLSVGIPGTGGMLEYGMAELQQRALPDMVIVPFKGASPAINAVLAGDVSMTIEAITALEPHVKSGKMRLIAVTSLKRQPFAPNLPAVAETLPGFDMSTWYGLIAAAGTPSTALLAISQALDAALRDPAVNARLVAGGWELQPGVGTREFSAFVASEKTRLEPIVRQLGAATR